MALTADRSTLNSAGEVVERPVEASTTLYGGGLVAVNAAGRFVPGAATAALKIVGIAEQQYDNSDGDAGAINGRARRLEAFWLDNAAGGDAITAAHIGKTCYASDDQTVRIFKDGETNIPVGRVLSIDTTNGVQVMVGDYPNLDELTIDGDLSVDDLTVGGNAEITGTLAVTGAITATGGVTGDVTGDVTGNLTGNVTGDVTGNLTGNVTGDVTGDVTGNLTGNVTGDVTGNLTGNVTGDVTGNADTATIGNGLFLHSEDLATVVPSDAQMVAAFGTRTSGIFFDTDAGNAGVGKVLYVCAFDGTNWNYVAMTAGA